MKPIARFPGTLAVLLTASLLVCASTDAAAGTGHDKATAERDAAHRLALLRLPPGAVRSATVPSGSGPELEGIGLIPSGGRVVARHAFWTAPGTRGEVFDFLRHHLPHGARLGPHFYGGGGFNGDGGSVGLHPPSGVANPRPSSGWSRGRAAAARSAPTPWSAGSPRVGRPRPIGRLTIKSCNDPVHNFSAPKRHNRARELA